MCSWHPAAYSPDHVCFLSVLFNPNSNNFFLPSSCDWRLLVKHFYASFWEKKGLCRLRLSFSVLIPSLLCLHSFVYDVDSDWTWTRLGLNSTMDKTRDSDKLNCEESTIIIWAGRDHDSKLLRLKLMQIQTTSYFQHLPVTVTVTHTCGGISESCRVWNQVQDRFWFYIWWIFWSGHPRHRPALL